MIWTKLAPMAYGAYDLGPGNFWTYPDYGVGVYDCAGGLVSPLSDAPKEAIAVPRQGDHLPYWANRRVVPWVDWPTAQPYVMALKGTTLSTLKTPTYPDKDKVMSKMFDPSSRSTTTTTRAAASAISREQFIPTLSRNNAEGCHWRNESGSTEIPPGPQ